MSRLQQQQEKLTSSHSKSIYRIKMATIHQLSIVVTSCLVISACLAKTTNAAQNPATPSLSKSTSDLAASGSTSTGYQADSLDQHHQQQYIQPVYHSTIDKREDDYYGAISQFNTQRALAAAAAAAAAVAPTQTTSAIGVYARQPQLASAASHNNGVEGGDLATAAGHHHGHAHGKYYEYREVPKKKTWKFGYKRGNHKHTIMRHEHGHAGKKHPHFKTKVKWHDKKSKGKGIHLWDYNHHDKKHGHYG